MMYSTTGMYCHCFFMSLKIDHIVVLLLAKIFSCCATVVEIVNKKPSGHNDAAEWFVCIPDKSSMFVSLFLLLFYAQLWLLFHAYLNDKR